MRKRAYSSYIREIETVVRSPVLFLHFLRGERTLNHGSLIFHLMPTQYSEPSVRLSLIVEGDDKTAFFLKVNSYTHKMENEYRALYLLEQHGKRSFYIPRVLGFGIEDASGFVPAQYGWILEEWISGESLLSSNPSHVELAAISLAQINQIEVDLSIIAGLFRVPILPVDKIKHNSRSSMVTEIEKAIQIANEPLILEFSKAIDLFSRDIISFTLSLNHGDFHLRNLLLIRRAEKLSTAVIDWEDVNLENPLYDLAHFVFLAEKDAIDVFLKKYFREAHDLYSQFSSDEISEAFMAMFNLWAARNLRWKSRQMSIDCIQRYYLILNKKIAAVRKLPWNTLLS